MALLTALLSSALLFAVQPLATKMLLPGFGGASATWTVASLFFQLALLFGYLGALALRRLPSRGWELSVYAACSALAIGSLPFDLSTATSDVHGPIASLLRVLVTQLGVPLLVLCATGPLLQTWWRDAVHGDSLHAARTNPLTLLAVGSVGSIGSVLAYVLFLESRFDSDVLSTWWRLAFIGVVTLVLACGIRLRASPAETRDATHHDAPALSLQVFARWMVLAAYATALLLATTNHVSHDIAAVPLLWVVPLVCFLIAYGIAYSPWRDRVMGPARWAQYALTLLALASIYVEMPLSVMSTIALHVLVCFASVLVAVSQLSALRGSERHLGAYNVAIGLGGALGGFFVGILAPWLFTTMIEYPLVLLAGLLVARSRPGHSLRQWIPVACGVVLWLVMLGRAQRSGSSIFVDRGFFGAYDVRRLNDQHLFYHGTTLHGRQSRVDSLRTRALGYYHPEGPLGQLLAELHGADTTARRALVVGLGAGALACAFQAPDRVTFLEIDPLVARIARDTTLFSYLADCAPSSRIVLGDARVTSRTLQGEQFDLIVLDAFSSDAIPVHLLTVEAFAEYASLLSPTGTIVAHVSNRFLTLQPVVGAAGASLGWLIARGDAGDGDSPSANHERDGSHWVAVTPDATTHAVILRARGWSRVSPGSRQVAWTDRRSSVLDVFSRR